MDYWFSWLSKTALDRPLICEYALIFARNELEEEDVPSFNHEFLQSMGISIAKHRLEILKLAQKEVKKSLHRIPRVILAINKAKKSITKSIAKWAFLKNLANVTGPDSIPLRAHWSGALRKQNISKEFNHEKVMDTNRSITMRSGPLDRRFQEKLMVTSRSLSVSGPIDGKLQEKLMSMNRSPTISDRPDGRLQEKSPYESWAFKPKYSSPTISDRSDGRLQEKSPHASWAFEPKYSSPTISDRSDGRLQEKSPHASWAFDAKDSSPRVNGDYGKKKMIGGNEDRSLWSLMFQDMKPT